MVSGSEMPVLRMWACACDKEAFVAEQRPKAANYLGTILLFQYQ